MCGEQLSCIQDCLFPGGVARAAMSSDWIMEDGTRLPAPPGDFLPAHLRGPPPAVQLVPDPPAGGPPEVTQGVPPMPPPLPLPALFDAAVGLRDQVAVMGELLHHLTVTPSGRAILRTVNGSISLQWMPHVWPVADVMWDEESESETEVWAGPDGARTEAPASDEDPLSDSDMP